MGFGPQLVDLDGDGILDIISGSWPGEIYFFKGGSHQTFADGVKIKGKNGKAINPAGGINKQSDGDITIAGDVEMKEEPNGTHYVIYEGEKLKAPEGKHFSITGCASAVFAVDWRHTGKLDLLVGEFGGRVFLVPNEGTRTQWSFDKAQELQAGGKPLKVDGDSGPFATDWDGDGKLDLIVGSGDGSVWLYRNIGTPEKPELAAGVQLVPPGAEVSHDVTKEVRRGCRAKVCVTDWDGDGKLDLLVGDFGLQKPDLPEPSPEQKTEHDKLRKERDELMKKIEPRIDKLYGEKKIAGEAEREKVQKEFEELKTKISEIEKKLPPEFEQHGWVWFFKRK